MSPQFEKARKVFWWAVRLGVAPPRKYMRHLVINGGKRVAQKDPA